MAVRNWNGDLVEVNWVYCNACGTQYVEEVYEGKCPECGSHSYCTDEEVAEAERELFGDEDMDVLEQAMEMNAGAFYDRMEWSD
jgi:predicted ATP-dependent serine protease